MDKAFTATRNFTHSRNTKVAENIKNCYNIAETSKYEHYSSRQKQLWQWLNVIKLVVYFCLFVRSETYRLIVNVTGQIISYAEDKLKQLKIGCRAICRTSIYQIVILYYLLNREIISSKSPKKQNWLSHIKYLGLTIFERLNGRNL